MRLRYVVARLVPDLIREEPINVGVILQSEDWVASKFIERIPKDWEVPGDLVEDVAIRLDASWRERLSVPSEVVYSAELHEHQTLSHTDRAFLEWIQQGDARHLRFSDIREADINITDTFDFETFLYRLYGIFVAPKPRPRKPVVRGRLHTDVRHEIAQLRIPPEKRVRERDVILGSFPWPVDFVYETNGNGTGRREVGIGLVDFTSVNFIAKAKDLVATWVDVKNVRQDEVTRITVVGALTGLDEQRKALEMVRRYSDALYVFDRQRDQLLEQIASDLLPLPHFIVQDTDQALGRPARPQLPQPGEERSEP